MTPVDNRETFILVPLKAKCRTAAYGHSAVHVIRVGQANTNALQDAHFAANEDCEDGGDTGSCDGVVLRPLLCLLPPSLPPCTPAPLRDEIDPNLVPQFGVQAGVNPDGTGNCDGVNGPNGQPILIPCSCPPDRNTFIADLNGNLAAGHVVNNPSVGISFPTDNSQASQLARLEAATVTLQNLHGPGVGCPQAATTFGAQVQAIQSGATPAAAPPPAAPAPAAPAPPPPTAAGGVDPSLVPAFGVVAGTSPDGHGNCAGVNGVLIPCSCPPDRNAFISDLNANVAAGHAVHNPSVAVSFPTDNSKASQQARIVALLVTLQNLNGPGVGCPGVHRVWAAAAADQRPPQLSAPCLKIAVCEKDGTDELRDELAVDSNTKFAKTQLFRAMRYALERKCRVNQLTNSYSDNDNDEYNNSPNS
ncbi:hypothetical protein A0H81_08519 [Grifola frondosa]|uniref:Uncharacterized protein n=1 Tax=Grifola frondosa TaxID=5627 RepID=A0A1C7M3B0_GRIFR|nr:hypothetical protein A0H81_08519 [Grifola frondosa]